MLLPQHSKALGVVYISIYRVYIYIQYLLHITNTERFAIIVIINIITSCTLDVKTGQGFGESETPLRWRSAFLAQSGWNHLSGYRVLNAQKISKNVVIQNKCIYFDSIIPGTTHTRWLLVTEGYVLKTWLSSQKKNRVCAWAELSEKLLGPKRFLSSSLQAKYLAFALHSKMRSDHVRQMDQWAHLAWESSIPYFSRCFWSSKIRFWKSRASWPLQKLGEKSQDDLQGCQFLDTALEWRVGNWKNSHLRLLAAAIPTLLTCFHRVISFCRFIACVSWQGISM